MELQTALEDHFSKQTLKNVCEYTLPSIKTMEEPKEFIKKPYSLRLEERSHE